MFPCLCSSGGLTSPRRTSTGSLSMSLRLRLRLRLSGRPSVHDVLCHGMVRRPQSGTLRPEASLICCMATLCPAVQLAHANSLLQQCCGAHVQ